MLDFILPFISHIIYGIINNKYESFHVDNVNGIYCSSITNAGNHIYPYLATAVSFTCLFIVLLVIIVAGPGLGR